MPETVTALSPALTERILDKLGLDHSPAPDAAGLQALYRAWCQKVPFDTIRRRILANDPPSQPLPGTTADDFFTHWLQFGTGGTCWAGHGALFALLMQLGFRAQLGVSRMLSSRPSPSILPVMVCCWSPSTIVLWWWMLRCFMAIRCRLRWQSMRIPSGARRFISRATVG